MPESNLVFNVDKFFKDDLCERISKISLSDKSDYHVSTILVIAIKFHLC